MTPKAEQSGVAFDQRIAKFVVRGLSRTPLTPNQVTLSSIFLGLAVAWMYIARRGDGARCGRVIHRDCLA